MVSEMKKSPKRKECAGSQTEDVVTFRVEKVEAETLTKRSVLSRMSMLSDPLGLATPVTI